MLVKSNISLIKDFSSPSISFDSDFALLHGMHTLSIFAFSTFFSSNTKEFMEIRSDSTSHMFFKLVAFVSPSLISFTSIPIALLSCKETPVTSISKEFSKIHGVPILLIFVSSIVSWIIKLSSGQNVLDVLSCTSTPKALLPFKGKFVIFSLSKLDGFFMFFICVPSGCLYND